MKMTRQTKCYHEPYNFLPVISVIYFFLKARHHYTTGNLITVVFALQRFLAMQSAACHHF
jgi:hypothetical protein